MNVSEKLGVIQMDLMEIEEQIAALYGQKKAKQKEANTIWSQVLVWAREGRTVYEKEK